MQSVAVFCGSGFGNIPAYQGAAQELGTLLASRGLRLVYGGAKVGLMGALADACLLARGEVVGVMPEALVAREIAHRSLTKLHIVGSMHERKALMADLADAFIALPGGFGTWDEFCEVVTWAQLGLHGKPCAVLNVEGYYDHLLAMTTRAVRDGFVRQEHVESLLWDDKPARLLDRIGSQVPILIGNPTAEKPRR